MASHKVPPIDNAASTVPKKSSKGKKQNNESKDVDLNVTFLKRELASAQTRITQLDAEISDKDKRISILKARVNILEERDNKASYDKYFSKSTSSSNSPQYSHHCCSPQLFCSAQHMRPASCIYSPHMNIGNIHPPSSVDDPSMVLEAINELRVDVSNIKKALALNDSPTQVVDSQQQSEPSDRPVSDHIQVVDLGEPHCDEPGSDSSPMNVSSTSVEMFIPDVHPSEYLN